MKKTPGLSRPSRKSTPVRPSKPATLTKSPSGTPHRSKPVAVVGIGASAGGLEAFTALFKTLPANTGMAFVLIQHLDPKRESVLPRILSQITVMPVCEATDRLELEPDHVYIMPPDKDVIISGGVLGLRPRGKSRGLHLPIDRFFHSLAEDQKDRAIGLILSGTASDGTSGLKAIREKGGITFTQDEASAKFSGMPHNAAASGASDFVLPPAGIAEELARISKLPFPQLKPAGQPSQAIAKDAFNQNGEELGAVFGRLRAATGVDFAQYKPGTPRRRIQRRMALRRIVTIKDYLNYLKANPDEVRVLFRDLLIPVTGFFRDPEAFAALSKRVLPDITRRRGPNADPLRIWVPGCSSGEEAYSLAICLLEFVGRRAAAFPIQIFATDIFEEAIDKARDGVYTESAVRNLSPGQLGSFFNKKNGHYQVNKKIREIIVFSKHDLTRDPPFSNLDLISCRNLLIYLRQAAQERIIGNFHYALRPGGFLILGKSEALGRFPDLFDAVDRKNKIYSRKPGPTRPYLEARRAGYHLTKGEISSQENGAELDIRKQADRILLSRLAPPGVIINHHFEIVDFRGNTGPFLEHRPGEASLNLLKIAREGLQVALRTAIQQAKKQAAAVRKEDLPADADGTLKVDLEVIPLRPSGHGDNHFLVLFKEAGVRQPRGGPEKGPIPGHGLTKSGLTKRENKRNTREELLKQELGAAKERLRTIIDENETASEELRAANEEALSANEELQSINEEMETAKEELQATNEELTTLNDEMQNRNVALDELNNDLMNLFTSANLLVIMLGRDLRIRRFTPMAEKRLGVMAADIGRSILNVGLNTDVPELRTLIEKSISGGEVSELEVQDRGGFWYDFQVRPYRTAQNKIDGVVLNWVDINPLKRSLEQIRESRDYAEAILKTVREPLIILNGNMRVKTANRSFYQIFQTSPEVTENLFLFSLGEGQWNITELKKSLNELLPRNAEFQDLEIEVDFPVVGRKTLRLNGRRILQDPGAAPLILLALEDITVQKQEAARRAEESLHRFQTQKLEAIGTLSGGIAHDLNNVLSPIIINAELGLLDIPAESPVREYLELILKSGVRARDLVKQVVLFSRSSGKRRIIFDLGPLIKETFKLLRSSVPSTIEMTTHLETGADAVWGDPTQIQQVILNLGANAAYALKDKKGSIDISLQSVRLEQGELPEADMRPGDYWVLSVADTGAGMDADVKRRIFEPFFTTKMTGEGAGLGLSVVHGIVKGHNGAVVVRSTPGKGSEFSVYLPKTEVNPQSAPTDAETIPGGNERILLVDDEEVVVQSVRNMLDHLGYRVTALSKSPEALRLFSQDPFQFDLVMSDQTMPSLTGEELGQAIKRIRPEIPFILCTGYGDFVSNEGAKASGFEAYLLKPYGLREAAAVLRNVLDERTLSGSKK